MNSAPDDSPNETPSCWLICKPLFSTIEPNSFSVNLPSLLPINLDTFNLPDAACALNLALFNR